MSQAIVNKVFYFSNNKGKDTKKAFKICLIRKLISPLNVQADTRNLSIHISDTFLDGKELKF